MFYLVGLGLADAKDITVKGLEIVKNAEKVYLEAYTSILTVGKEALESYYGREVILADRETVEQLADDLLSGAVESDVVLLVVGDPFGATTHTDLVLRAKQAGIEVGVVHNASIMNAVGCCGLQLYSYGETVSIVFWSDNWKPESFYDKICHNSQRGLHTLCLLDIKMKEQSVENLIRGRQIFEPPRFMTTQQAAEQLIAIYKRRTASSDGKGDSSDDEAAADQNLFTDVTEESLAVGVTRVGSDSQRIAAGTLQQLADTDLGDPLHSLVVVGHMHCLERDMLRQYAIDVADFDERTKHVKE
ncbi:diphthine methyl ester synthase-like [Sycon ciliatum]|uniref:diphthine methyl ester synthase-like n=1 Tax=Sycon ciliatum TaxID=27933 RepID=UPI0031F6DB1F